MVATTVETLGLLDNVNYKGGMGDDDRKVFLKGIADLFAIHEKPKAENNQSNLYDLDYTLIKNIESKYKIIKSLESLEPLNKPINDRYIIITIMNGKSLVTSFYNKELARLYYSTLEKNIDDSIQIFMLSTDNIKELKKSYPNWFNETREFINFYIKFINV